MREAGDDPKVRRVAAAAEAAGVSIKPLTFEAETRTSVDAAREVGCSVAEIAKSLVFAHEPPAGEERTVLLLLSGTDRVDLARAANALGGGKLKRADAETAKAVTGYSIGATPPFGHAHPIEVFMDDHLLEMDSVWAAGGRTDTVFEIATEDLRRISGAEVKRLRETG